MPILKSEWKLKVRVWVEHDGEKVLGPGRVELLGHIDRLHSISAAAKQMGMSYRRAWSLVHAMNDAAGEPLVAASTGGARGGGAILTPHGQAVMALYRRISDRAAQAAGKAMHTRR